MRTEEDVIRNLSHQYFLKVIKAFDNVNVDYSSKAIETIAKSLNDLFRYFEPSFFKGRFYLITNIKDKVLLDQTKSVNVFDKSILINRTSGLLVMQVFKDETYKLWEGEEVENILNQKDSLIYCYENNKEHLFANGQEIDLTIHNEGSRYATQFTGLKSALQSFGQHKIFNSSCAHFSQSWADSNRLFFRGGGRGSNIPEKYMQLSLNEYLTTFYSARGVTFETAREYNINGDFSKPKPVDIKATWREANRIAIIEVKFMGAVRTTAGTVYNHSDPRANEGITQVKAYYDALLTDSPTSIIKAYLLVIDGRRSNLNNDDSPISFADGMNYKDIDIIINEDNKFHESIPGFEKLIRVFAAPVTV